MLATEVEIIANCHARARADALELEDANERLQAEAAATALAIKDFCAYCDNSQLEIECDNCWLQDVKSTTAGADLLEHHKAEVAVYRDALDQIRNEWDGDSDWSNMQESLYEIGRLASGALNDHRITGGSK